MADDSVSDIDSYAESDNDESVLQNGSNESDPYPPAMNGESDPSKNDSVADSIAKKDTKAALSLRVLVIALFVFMSFFVPIIIHKSASDNEEEGFRSEFKALATKVIDSFKFNVARKLGAIDSLDISVTSYAQGTGAPSPNVTMPDFDLRAANTLALADTFSVFLVPLVETSGREEWEAYAKDHQGWIETAVNRKTASSHRLLDGTVNGIYDTIYRLDENGEKVPEVNGSDPLYPVWQNAPVFEEIVNFNLLSVDSLSDGIREMKETKEAVLGRVVEFADNEGLLQEYFRSLLPKKEEDNEDFDGDEPISNLFYPVFDEFGTNASLLGLFSMVIYWRTFFGGVLPSNANDIVCVIENECGQKFTYEINGEGTTFKGSFDAHDADFDWLFEADEINNVTESESFNFREASIPLNRDFCTYTLTVYPTKELKKQHITFRPALYTAGVALAFVLISAVAITYDCVVQRRLKSVLDSALESRAIVSSLFPANVRDRLFESDDGPPKREKTFGEAMSDGKEHDKDNNMTAHPAKLRLKSFLHETPKNSNSDVNVLQTKPIADLFPHCTVLFADIAGFTAWSSEREPAQVFTLLQTIFHFFDNIARKWGVFKVETIGDCYVAVTGLPDPQEDHAVRMTKFARECLRKVTDLTHKLETTLGPDTGDLSMRFGLHSGPVTAGVLRGEKSRFQLFGDTVNTASRMESSGKKDFIQVSQSTADLLVEAGKESWISPREDLVSAKGKGQIQTYWVTAKKEVIASSNGTAIDSDDRSDDTGDNNAQGKAQSVPANVFDMQPLSQNRKMKRLIDWQTDILARLLKQLAGHRDRKAASKFVAEPRSVLEKGECVLDEVAEVLYLPKFDEAHKASNNSKSTELSPAVMSQLRDYVGVMSSRYNDNPFHNFEHASHVTMSASKLLNRIVVPEDVNYQRNNAQAIASDLHDYTYGITSDPLTQFAVIFCALIHDVDHRGVSNFQLGVEIPDMAKKYKNRGLAEQNSVDIAWEVLMQPEYRNLQQCIFTNEDELKRFRQLVVNLVMATDIFDKEMKALRNSRWDKAFHKDADATPLDEEETFNFKATIVIEHIIQAADVAHTMQHWHVYTKWNERLFQEMYLAYEKGRSKKDPSEGWYKGELWFFDNYVIPLAKKLDECNVFGVASDEGLNYALANRAEWAVKGDDIVREMVHRYNDRKQSMEKTDGSKKEDSQNELSDDEF